MIARRSLLVRWARGSSLLELVVSAVVIAILTGVLLQRLQTYQQAAERTAIDTTIAILRVALATKSAQLIARGSDQEVAALATQNPITWLERPPHQYAGEYFDPAEGSVPRGHWYFDRKQQLLIYLLNSRSLFPQGTPNAEKYKVELLRRNNDSYEPTMTAPVAVVLVRVAG